MGNNLYNKPLAKEKKIFPIDSLRTFIGFTYLYVICHLGHVSKKILAKAINPIIAC